MSMVYLPDKLVSDIINTGKNKSVFVKEAIKEKLERENNLCAY